ncbi:MAG: TIGR00725 family protein [Acidobacteriota bacterium]
MGPKRHQIAVVGAARCDPLLSRKGEEVGRLLAEAGVTLLTGGRGGVMAAASRGAHLAGGRTVAISPSLGESPNATDEVVIATGMGQARNLVLVLSARAVIAVGGGWGTLSEIALALKHGIPVVCLESWMPELPDGAPEPLLQKAESPADAVQKALRS